MYSLDDYSPAHRREILALLELQAKLASENKLADYRPYAKQREFHESGKNNDETLFIAGNQLGKTWAGAYEMSMHLTGIYPDWWAGRIFDRPIKAMAGSESSELTRKGIQNLLLGTPEIESEWGTGAIPKLAIESWSRKQGVPNTIDNIVVKHISGGISTLNFASYDQGRGKWQAATVDLVWFDEEPPEEVYMEGITRTNATSGYVYVTFTPLLGASKVVSRFYPTRKFPYCNYIQMGINDAEHYTPEQREKIIMKYPSHERDARAKGIPKLGSGAVFPIDEEYIKCAPFPIPEHWPQICGIDFGWDHPSAGVRIAWDRDNDILYVIATHRAREQTPAMFSAAVRPWGDWLRWAWPHDGLQHDKGSGEQLALQYRQTGLGMLPERATFEDGSNGLEAGVSEMLDRMQTGRLKVFSHLNDWFEEFRLYHRKEGIIVKLNDDILSATRYAMMMRRFASTRIKKVVKFLSNDGGSWMG